MYRQTESDAIIILNREKLLFCRKLYSVFQTSIVELYIIYIEILYNSIKETIFFII